MILNSGRHTQPDPQSCRVRSLGGRRGEPKNKQRIKRPKQNWAVRRPIVTKQSAANSNTEKSIPPAMSQGISTSCSARPEDKARLMGTNLYNTRQDWISWNQKMLVMITSQDIHCFHESLQSKMRTHAPCGTLTSKHMQISVSLAK